MIRVVTSLDKERLSKCRLSSMRKTILLSILYCTVISYVHAQDKPVGLVEGQVLPEIPNQYKHIERIWQIHNLRFPWLLSDTNADGVYDIAYTVDDITHVTQKELIDTNNDGYVDEFSYFDENGKIVYQEFDTNNDRKVDYWAEIYSGERVLRIQRDLTYDGYINRDFNFKEQLE